MTKDGGYQKVSWTEKEINLSLVSFPNFFPLLCSMEDGFQDLLGLPLVLFHMVHSTKARGPSQVPEMPSFKTR